MGETLRVLGYRELLRACDHAEKDTKRFVREAFREVGDEVRKDATRIFAAVNIRSAEGFRTRVRLRGVAVEQSLRKTTGKRPDYGALQMTKALIPAVRENEPATERALDKAIDRVADHFERD